MKTEMFHRNSSQIEGNLKWGGNASLAFGDGRLRKKPITSKKTSREHRAMKKKT